MRPTPEKRAFRVNPKGIQMEMRVNEDGVVERYTHAAGRWVRLLTGDGAKPYRFEGVDALLTFLNTHYSWIGLIILTLPPTEDQNDAD
jgi:hypothetical protein